MDRSEDELICAQGRRTAIMGACWKVGSYLTLSNGVMLLYLKSLGLEGSTALFLLSLSNVTQALFYIPSAYYADRIGRKRTGIYGIVICGVAFALIPLAGWMSAWHVGMIVLLSGGLLLYGAGHALQMGGWFSLLTPLVPEKIRGHFLGVMRVLWQSVSVVFALLVMLVLPKESPVWVWQVVLAVAAFSIIPWGLYYARIPEMESFGPSNVSLVQSVVHALRLPGHAGFCAYVFIIMLFASSCPMLFNLVEKETLFIRDGYIILLANLTMVGSVVGFWLGGKAVDRFGTKWVFFSCHVAFGLVVVLFLLRDQTSLPLVPVLGMIHFMFGLPLAASSIAMSKEMMALAPKRNNAVAMALVQTLILAGTALSGTLSGWGLKAGIFSQKWSLFGQPRDACDATLLVFSVMIVLMTVTLGLIPSVIGGQVTTANEV